MRLVLFFTALSLALLTVISHSQAAKGQNQDCGTNTSSTDCPSGCVWDCKRNVCRVPLCKDYPSNLACPSACAWDCPRQECVSV